MRVPSAPSSGTAGGCAASPLGAFAPPVVQPCRCSLAAAAAATVAATVAAAATGAIPSATPGAVAKPRVAGAHVGRGRRGGAEEALVSKQAATAVEVAAPAAPAATAAAATAAATAATVNASATGTTVSATSTTDTTCSATSTTGTAPLGGRRWVLGPDHQPAARLSGVVCRHASRPGRCPTKGNPTPSGGGVSVA